MKNLFLDDIRIPNDVLYYIQDAIYVKNDWVIVRTYDQFVKYIVENGLPDLISFDHDLSDQHYPKTYADAYSAIDYGKYTEKTGYDCAKFLINYIMDNDIKFIPQYKIHSMNPVGGENIRNLLKNFSEKYLK